MTTRDNKGDTSKRGFASMPPEVVHDIAVKGGHASAEKAGHDGMVARGHQGGKTSAERAGHDEMAERGHLGGIASGQAREKRKENKLKSQEEQEEEQQ